VLLDEFDEDAPGRAGVEKRHRVAEGARTGFGVDELESIRAESREVLLEIAGTVGDVVQPGAGALEESADAGVRRQGFEELQLRSDETDPDALGLQGLDRGTSVAGHGFVEWYGRGE
jgi:hypothetical protein